MILRLLSAERDAVAQHNFFGAIAFCTLLCRRCYKGIWAVTSSFAVPTPTPAQARAPAPGGDSSAAPTSRTAFRTTCGDKKVALQIVPINVTAGGKSATTLGLLDPGSEGTFVSKALAERLAAKPKASERITLSTVTGESTVNLPTLDLLLQPDNCRGTPELVPVNARVLTTLNIEVDPAINARKWPHLVDIDLPATTADVEILVGAGVPEAHLQLETRIGRRGEPYAVKSIFGWTLMGPTGEARASERPLSINFTQCNAALNRQVEPSFNLDANEGLTKHLSVEDRRVRSKLEADTHIVDGRCDVPMHWKTDTPLLPDNKPMAERRVACLDAEALVNAQEWFDGPGFLSSEESAWPAQPTVSAVSDDHVEVKPARRQVHCAQVSGSLDKLLNHYGTWTRLRRGVAYIIRFCQWLLSRRTPQSSKLSHEDISNATDLIIRHAQQRAYPEEWAVVTAGKPVSTSSGVASLCPFLRGGVLCVGGRLARAGALSCDERHPAIVPKRHHVSELIMRYYHERTAHAGPR